MFDSAFAYVTDAVVIVVGVLAVTEFVFKASAGTLGKRVQVVLDGCESAVFGTADEPVSVAVIHIGTSRGMNVVGFGIR